MKELFLIVALICTFQLQAFAEIVYLKNGEKVEGEIITKSDDRVVIKNKMGMELTYYKEEIKQLDESLTPGATNDIRISQDEVQSAVKKLESGFNLKNINSIKELFWDDAKFVMNDFGNKLEFSLNRYLEIVQETLSQLNPLVYKYDVKNIKIVGNQAFCSGIVEETMTAEDGSKVVTRSQAEDIFEKRDGKLKLVYSQTDTISVE